MDFYSTIFGGGDDNDPNVPSPDAFSKAFFTGLRLADEYQQKIIKEAETLMKQGRAVEAMALISVAVWRPVGWAEVGVKKTSEQLDSKTNPVARMWQILQLAMRASTPDEGVEALKKWNEENGND